jgi:mannose/fructose/N-acetylgalactosamine-specific phosphotransferase system component IIC
MKSHRTDSVSLFFGLAFLMISLGYLAKVYLDLNLPSMGWFVAGGLIFLGIVGAVTALVPTRRPQQPPLAEDVQQLAEDVQQQEDENVDADAEQAR